MKELYIPIADIYVTLNEKDILKLVATYYSEITYGVSPSEEDFCLEEFEDYVDTGSGNLLINIQNTLANIDRSYDENEEDWYPDEEEYDNDEDWDEDDYDEDYYEIYDEEDDEDYDDCNEEDSILEINRRKNEEALGIILP